MDPTATWNLMETAVISANWDEAAEHAGNLLNWLERDGFPPAIGGHPVFDRIVARETCKAIAAWEVV